MADAAAPPPTIPPVEFPLCEAAFEIMTLVQARYPLLAVLTSEEERAMSNIAVVAERLGKVTFEWTLSRGLVRYRLSMAPKAEGKKGTKDPIAALGEVLDISEPAIVVFKDFQPHLKEAAVRRRLRDLAQALRHTYVTVILLGPPFTLPQELEKDVTLMDFPLPTKAELGELLSRIEREIAGSADFHVTQVAEERDELLSAALGLTLAEAENVFAKALVSTGRLTREEVSFVFGEKRQIIRKSDLLEYVEVRETVQDIGGMENLKTWLRRRAFAFTPQARASGLPAPRGVLLTGVQGCGKSLCAKAVATLYNLPLLRMDMGLVFASHVGESEARIRSALKLAQSVAPCVLWVDEIDKGLAGLRSSGSSDSGTSQRVFGTLVTWMQENRKPVFLVATANNIENLPPEVLRKGRFDDIFFVDLPDREARIQILGIQLRRYGREPGEFDLGALAELCEDFSGAEIESAIVDGLFRALSDGRELESGDIAAAMAETFPLALTMKEDIRRIREWAKGRARPAA